MQKLLFLIVALTALLYAGIPKIYGSLGDRIYLNMVNIANLAEVGLMANEQEDIDNYLRKCLALEQEGLKIDREGGDKKAYLIALRALAGEYDRLVRNAEIVLMNAISANDYQGFKELIQTGVITIDKYGRKITEFYRLNRPEGDVIPEVESYMVYMNELKEKRQADASERKAAYQNYKQRRIDLIHKRQDEKKAAFYREVEAERERTKEEVYKEQQEELEIKR